MSSQSRSRSVLKWAFAMNWGKQGIATIVTFVLAALLGPEQFGTVAIAMVYIGFLETVLKQGMEAALIQRKDLASAHSDSAFWVILCASVGLAGLSFSLSQWWAALNKNDEIGPVISVLSLSIILQGLTVVQQALVKRALQFKVLAIRSNIAEFVSGAVGIGAAFSGLGVWALVIQQLVREVLGLLLLWGLSPWRPSWGFSPVHFKELFVFSAASFASGMASFLQRRADVLIIGLYFGPVAVGLLRLADRVKESLLDLVTRPISAISLPVLAKCQDRPTELSRKYLDLLRASLCITVPVMASLSALSGPILEVIGEQWLPAASALSLLAVAGIVQAFTLLTGPVLQAVAKPRLMAVMAWGLAVLNIVAFVTAAFLLQGAAPSQQVQGFALSRLFVFITAYLPASLWFSMKASHATLREIARAAWPGGITGLCVWTVLTALRHLGLTMSKGPIVTLIVLTVLGGSIAIGMTVWLEPRSRTLLREGYHRLCAILRGCGSFFVGYKTT